MYAVLRDIEINVQNIKIRRIYVGLHQTLRYRMKGRPYSHHVRELTLIFII